MSKRGATKYDRAAVMRDAHRRYRNGLRHRMGWSFGHCLSTAWAAAKLRRVGAGVEKTDNLLMSIACVRREASVC